MTEVRVIARFVASKGKEDQLKTLLQSMLTPTRAEPGCERYELYESDSRGRFYLSETWESQAALDQHISDSSLQAPGASCWGIVERTVRGQHLTQHSARRPYGVIPLSKPSFTRCRYTDMVSPAERLLNLKSLCLTFSLAYTPENTRPRYRGLVGARRAFCDRDRN